MLVKGIFEEKEETMSTTPKWFQSFETNINIRLDKIEKRLDIIEKRLDVIEKRLDVIENCPTIKQELSLNMTQS